MKPLVFCLISCGLALAVNSHVNSMNLSTDECINLLTHEGWEHLETRDGTKFTDNYLMRPPNSSEAKWFRAGALKALVLHTI